MRSLLSWYPSAKVRLPFLCKMPGGGCSLVSGALVHFPSIPADLGCGMLPQTSFLTQSPMTLHKQQCALLHFAETRKGRQKTPCAKQSPGQEAQGETFFLNVSQSGGQTELEVRVLILT